MCNVLDAREARGEARGRAEGKLWMLVKLTKDGTITVQTAAEEANMSEEEFKKVMGTMTRKSPCKNKTLFEPLS